MTNWPPLDRQEGAIMNPIQKYVLGFAFCDNREFVLMVRKERGPQINIGKLNGIGGRIENDELPLKAMERECREEAGVEAEWHELGVMKGKDWEVHLFCADFVFDDKIPQTNDVGEPQDLEESASVMNPLYATHYARNVPSMVCHAITGSGKLNIEVDN